MTPRRSTLRADAQRNREHLLATAAEAFASGQAISLDAIAKRAGVGSGTLYRHFPTREDLVEEVYRDQIRPLRDDARALLETQPPAQALHTWMHRFAEWTSERRGDIDPVDVGSILASVLSVAGAPEQRARLDRMLTIVVDGLRSR